MRRMEYQLCSDFPRLAYSLAELEVLTGLSRSTLYRRCRAGKLRTVRLGRRRLVPASVIGSLLTGSPASEAPIPPGVAMNDLASLTSSESRP